MSKGGSSETRTEVPQWLSDALRPLLQQSTAGLRAFGAQGQNVLHGLPFNQGLPTLEQGQGIQEGQGNSFNDLLRRYYGGGSKNAGGKGTERLRNHVGGE